MIELSVLIFIAETVIIFTLSRSRFYESLAWSRILDSVYKSLFRSMVGKYYLEHNQDNRYDCQIKLLCAFLSECGFSQHRHDTIPLISDFHK